MAERLVGLDLNGNALRIANALFRRVGLRIERTTKHKSVGDFFGARHIDLVIDVGANEGQFGLQIRRDGFIGQIRSFEPLESAFKKLAAVSKRYPPWDVFNFGLSDHEGYAELNVAEYSVFSSLNRLREEAVAFNREAQFVRKQSVHLKTLDSIMADLERHRAFLKIDTQGHEEAVLRGAEGCLEKLWGVQMELPISHLYEGVWQLEDAVSYMRARDFSISNVIPTNFAQHSDPVSVLELDCIFRNNRLS